MALLERPFGPAAPAANVATMPAQNTQAQNLPNPLPATQSITSTAETLIVSPANPSVALSIAIPPSTALEQMPFDLNISGYIKTTNSTNITLTLYAGTAIVSGNLLKASTATAQNSGTAPFWVKGKLIYDSVSGKLAGTVGFYINGTLVAEATLANTVTGISNTNSPVVQFCLSITSSAASGGNPTTINVNAFSAG